MATTKNIGITTLGNLASPLAGILAAPILAQSLGAAGRGEVGAATAPLVLGVSLFALGMPESMTYFVAQGRVRAARHLAGPLAVITAAGVVSTLLVIAAAPLLAGDDPELANLIRAITVMLVPALWIGLLRGAFAGLGAWNLIAVERILGSFLRLAGVVVLWLTDTLTVEAASFAIGITTFVGGLVYLNPKAARRASVSRSTDRSDERPATTRAMSRFALQVWAGSLAGVLLSRLDQALVTPLSSVEQLGYYAVAVSVAEVVLVFNSAVRDVMFAQQSEIPDMDQLGRASRLSTVVTVATGLLLGTSGYFLLPVIFGRDFEPAVPVLLILLVGIAAGNPGSIAGAGLTARGYPHLRSVSLVVAVLVNVGVLFLLVPDHGAVGAAWATVVGNIVAGYTNIVWLRIKCGVSPATFLSLQRDDLARGSAAIAGIIRRRRDDR